MNNLDDKRYWIWFSMVKGLGVKRKQKLLELYGSPEKIYKLDKEKLFKIEGFGNKLVDYIIKSKNQEVIDSQIKLMKCNSVDIINIFDQNYPQKLREIYDAPICLFVKGNKEILNQDNIGIVGCRECTEYGKKAAKYFAYNLTKEGKNIVSGLAKGVDSFAHIGSLSTMYQEIINNNIKEITKETNEVNKKKLYGKTIAVVGNGLDIVYPKENTELAEQIILSGGAIISEYPCGTKPNKLNFPARNRIISGISTGIIVVEAKEKSGTLITVDFALEQGREVFVVPGNINSINSVGTNELIKQGAKLINNYKDILL